MTTLNIIFGLIISLISVFLCVQLLKLYSRFKRTSDNTTAKNIYVINYNDGADEDVFPKTGSAVEPAAPQPKGSERRRFPRDNFPGFVDFISQGTLYKEQARDLSYTGIFIKSRTPEKYKTNDFIVMTFQTKKAGPQRRKGRIARIDHTGIGVNFIP